MRRKATQVSTTDWFSRVTTICAAPVFIASAFALMSMAFSTLDAATRPHVGAVVDFVNRPRHAEARPMLLTGPVHVHVAPGPGRAGSTCTIEPSAAVAGGSLIVERIVPGEPDQYLAHWIGIRTSWDKDSCGTAADLLLSRRDIETLALAGGGFLVGP